MNDTQKASLSEAKAKAEYVLERCNGRIIPTEGEMALAKAVLALCAALASEPEGVANG